jgi:hypothetical protein
VVLIFSVPLADAAHQPVAGSVEQSGGGAVLGGDRLRVERVPQFGGAVVEGEGVVHGRFGSGFGRVDEQHLAVVPNTSPLIVTSSAMPAKVSA